MFLSHWGYGKFGSPPSFSHFHPFFARFHHIHSSLGEGIRESLKQKSLPYGASGTSECVQGDREE